MALPLISHGLIQTKSWSGQREGERKKDSFWDGGMLCLQILYSENAHLIER